MSCPIPPAPNLVVCRQVGEQRRAAILVLNDKLLRASNQTNETLLNHMSHDPCQISNFQTTSWKAENIVHRQYAPGSQWWSTVDILQSFKTLRLFILNFVALSESIPLGGKIHYIAFFIHSYVLYLYPIFLPKLGYFIFVKSLKNNPLA